MKSLRLLIGLLLCSQIAFAQDNAIQKTIDEQVWLPFIKTFNAFDGEGFNALHTKDVLRGGPWGIQTGEEYWKNNLESNKKGKESGGKKSIAFRFEHRVARDSIAYEVGYYKVKYTHDGEERTGYGRFDVVLRKVNGVWKIAQDWDVDNINGKKFTEEDFVGNSAGKIYQ
ncbi:MAG: nuclear transport factor 2 family protein [Saprospiraceae bacterium]|nr:nuclear transport factor 2 family protein [Saprospiraceae bacterium]